MTDQHPDQSSAPVPPDFRALCAELLRELDHASHRDYQQELKDRARAALAQPVPPRPTDEELWHTGDEDFRKNTWPMDAVRFARAVLARWGNATLQPVPVSERLPGPEDCLDEGWAWFFNPRTGWRQASQPVHSAYTHWLPAHALPIPGDNQP